MPSKFLNNKIRCIVGASILFCIGSLVFNPTVVSTVAANSCTSVDFKYIDPYVNYLSLYIPSEELSEKTLSGMNIWEVLFETQEVYKEGQIPLMLQETLIVNKDYGIPRDFNKTGVNQEANSMFLEMQKDANKDGVYLNSFSTYRSYDRQSALYRRYVARDGQAKADTYSARPGFSEHQTGLAFDICGANSSLAANRGFNNTKEAQWLKDNAYKYGFILRYPEGKTKETGYMHESWHYRFVGTELSSKIYDANVSMEKYFGLDEISDLKYYLPEV